MKKLFGFLALFFAALVLFSTPVLAATGDITIDDTKVNAIIALMSGSAAVAVIQWVKNKLNWGGVMGYVLAALIAAAFTAGYFAYLLVFQHEAWNWLAIGIYWVAVFVYQKFGYSISKFLGMIKSGGTPAT